MLRSSRRARIRLALESLEPRHLLDGGGWAYGEVSPEWFQTLPGRDAAVEVTGFARANGTGINDTTFSNDPNLRRWIVRFTEASLSGIDGVGGTQQLLAGSAVTFTVIRGLGLTGQVEVETTEPDEAKVIAAYQSNPLVDYFFLDSLVVSQSLPNDALLPQQWGLDNRGVGIDGNAEGVAGADVRAADAFLIATGRRDVIVSVVDSGIDYSHPDLYQNIWINRGEIPPAIERTLADVDRDGLITFVDLNHPGNAGSASDLNSSGYIDAGDLLADPRWRDGVDSDGNGFVDDLHGYDFHNNDADPLDDSGHGTHVSGTIAASGGNGIGVAGVAHTTTLMPLKFLSGNDLGATANGTRAINYATMMRTRFGQNVRVINNSWGGELFNRGLLDAIQASAAADLLLVAGAGNGDTSRSGVDNDAVPFYPASYDVANIIAVTASGRSDELAPFANFGAASVDLAAPGVSILSTLPGGEYGFRHGTSMAAAFVSGAAALQYADVPYATFEEVRASVLGSVDPLPSSVDRGKVSSGGRLDAAATLALDTIAPRVSISLNDDFARQGTRPAIITARFTDNVAIDVATLMGNLGSLIITRQDEPAFEVVVPPVRVSSMSNEATIIVSYEFLPPGGSWNVSDNGMYRLSLMPGSGVDTAGNSPEVPELVIAEFLPDPPVAEAALSTLFGNLNGDRLPDLVQIPFEGQEVLVHLNDGRGSFSGTPIRVPVRGEPASVALGDFNRNGLTDLLVVSVGSAVVELFFDFDGTRFSPSTTITAAASPLGESEPYLPTEVVSEDLNQDGLNDLVFALLSHRVSVLLNQGNGTFSAPQLFETSDRNIDELILSAGGNLQDVLPLGRNLDRLMAAGDFDGDGLADLAVASTAPLFIPQVSNVESLLLLRGMGDGTFQRVPNVPVSRDVMLESIQVADFNSDGVDDLMTVGLGGAGGDFLLSNVSSGAFEPSTLPAPGMHSFVISSEPADLDGDGDADLVRANVFSEDLDQNGEVELSEPSVVDVRWLEDDGHGNFAERFITIDLPLDFISASVLAADLDADGRDDVILLGGGFVRTIIPYRNRTVHRVDGLFRVDALPLQVTIPSDEAALPPRDATRPRVRDQSLRSALAEANGSAGIDQILVPAGRFVLTTAESAQAPLDSGDLDITDDLTIIGAGADVTFIDGNQLDRVLHVHPGVTLTLSGVTITGGNGGAGAGIFNEGTLILEDVLITANQSSGRGGGLFNRGTAILQRSTIAGNSARDEGGGIFNDSVLELHSSTVSSNAAPIGGGISHSQPSSADGVRATIVQSTITANQAIFRGGGIVGAEEFPQPLDSQPTVEVRNSLIAGNNAGQEGGDVEGTLQVDGSSLVGLSGDPNSTLDPMLGPLTNNGGTTPTHAPLPGSPLIDAGDGSSPPTSDQRGSVRVLDGNGDGNAVIDIGAVEFSDFSVTSTLDSVDADRSDEVGVDAQGNATLRAAIQQANASAGPDTITLPAGTFVFTLTGRGEDAGASGDLDVTDELTIVGQGVELTTIDADALDRVFDIFPAATLRLRDLTISGGLTGAESPSSQETGGGLRNAGRLLLDRVRVVDNEAEDGGGGLQNQANASAEIRRSIFSANTVTGTAADAGGGAVRNAGVLLIDASTIDGNVATERGGGVLNSGVATVTASTLSRNTAAAGGGWFQAAGRANLVTSTLSGNAADRSDGGGIFQASGSLTIQSSTIAENTAATGGGGIRRSAGTIRLGNTLLAKNVAAGDPDLGGVFESLGRNLVGNLGTASGIVGGVKGDLVGLPSAAVGLGPLLDNGGPTLTHAITALSPAVDAGGTAAAGSLPRDQRGGIRDQGNLDIGAFEFLTDTIFVRKTVDSADPTADECTDHTCSLREAAMEVDRRGRLTTIVLEAGLYELSIEDADPRLDDDASLSGDLDFLSIPARIIGSGADVTSIDANRISRALHVGDSLELVGITITGGDTGRIEPMGLANSNDGGGILNQGNLTLRDSVVTGNRAAGNGGGIGGAGGTRAYATVIRSNQATRNGGGIAGHNLILEDSSLLSNTSGNFGGGLFLDGGTSQIERSTIAFNVAEVGGGLYGDGQSASFFNVTLSSNRATREIGGASANGGELNFDSSTIYGNSAPSIGGLDASRTSGLSLRNSIVAGNVATGITDGVGIFVSAGFNLFGDQGDPQSPAAQGFIASDLVGNQDGAIDPIVGVLVELTNDRGPTLTHALAAGSPAVDSGSSGRTVDQRGQPRGFDGDQNGIRQDDVGAYELIIDQTAPVVTIGDFGRFISPGSPTHRIELVYRDSSGVDPFTIDDNDVVVQTPLLNPDTGQLVQVPARAREVVVEPLSGETRVTYEFTAPGGSWDRSDDGDYTLLLQPREVADRSGNFVVPVAITIDVDLTGIQYPSVSGLQVAPDPNPGRPDGMFTFSLSSASVFDFDLNTRVEYYVDVDGDRLINQDVDVQLFDAPLDQGPLPVLTVRGADLRLGQLGRRQVTVLAAARGTDVDRGAIDVLGVPDAITFTVIELDGPRAVLNAPDLVSSASDTEYLFSVTFSDETAIDVSSIGTGDLRIDGPGGFQTTAQLVNVDAAENSPRRIATYRITPPEGTLSIDDNGFYNVSLLEGAVRDVNGNASQQASLGGFTFEFVIPVSVSGSISGSVLEDNDVAVAHPLSGQTVYLDLNQNGRFNAGEPSAVSDASGRYTIRYDDIPSGRYAVLYAGNRVVTSPQTSDFATQRIETSTQKFSISLAVGRLDSDALPDLVVANYNDSTLGVRRNDGGGGFHDNETPLAVPAGPFSVKVTDLDGALGDDIVVVNELASSVSIYLNDGSGGFSQRQDFSLRTPAGVSLAPTSLAIGDIDGDADLDLAVAIRTNAVAILRNNGFSRDQVLAGASFFSPPVMLALDAGEFPSALVMEHLDDDNRLDLAVASNGSAGQYRVTVLFSSGVAAGSVSAAGDLFSNQRAVINLPLPIAAILAGDFQGDQRPDLAVIQKPLQRTDPRGTVSILRNAGNRSLVVDTQPLTGNVPYTSLAAADLNGDQRLELIASTSVTRNVAVFSRAQSGELSEETSFPIAEIPITFQYSVATSDVDADQQPDLLVSDSGGVSILRNARGGHVVDLTANLMLSARDFVVVDQPDPGSLDFGDAPTASQSGLASGYPTLLGENGARHTIGELFLGMAPTAEPDGNPDPAAARDQDDGIVFPVEVIVSSEAATTSSFVAAASQAGRIDAWIDFNRDGDWVDPGEQIASNVSVSAGNQILPFQVPSGSIAGDTFARFRISSTGGLGPSGAAGDGEVEDYRIRLNSAQAAPELRVSAAGFPALIVSLENNRVAFHSASSIVFSAGRSEVGAIEVSGQAGQTPLRVDPLSATIVGDLDLASAIARVLRLVGGDQVLDLVALSDAALAGIETIDLAGPGSHRLILDAGEIDNLTHTRRLRLVSDPGDTIQVADGFQFVRVELEDGRLVHTFQQNGSSIVFVGPRDWTNPVNPFDVNQDQNTTANDALAIVNELARRRFSSASGVFVDPVTIIDLSLVRFYDVSRDGKVTALDALQVINRLARITIRSAASAEPEPSNATPIVWPPSEVRGLPAGGRVDVPRDAPVSLDRPAKLVGEFASPRVAASSAAAATSVLGNRSREDVDTGLSAEAVDAVLTGDGV